MTVFIGDIVADARELIEKGWTQGAEARGSDGYMVPAIDNRAVRWCLSGALYKCAVEKKDARLYSAYRIVAVAIENIVRQTTEFDCVVDFNDNKWTTKQTVLKFLDEAMERFKVTMGMPV